MQKQLDGGLILRSISEGVPGDRANLASFYAQTFGAAGDDDPEGLRLWTEELLAESHPTVTDDDLWVVVDPTKEDKIVSALLLIPQTWRYEDVEFGVGRVELVATDKDYRNRGLIRALMTAAHERSAALGHLVQGITGIRHYYRRFGYGMAVDLGVRNILPIAAIPKLPEDVPPRYHLRPAAQADIPDIMRWDEAHARTRGVSTARDERLWRFELTGRGAEVIWNMNLHIIADAQGRGVGYVSLRLNQRSPFFSLYSYVVGEESSYLATYQDVLLGCKQFMEQRLSPEMREKVPWLYFDAGVPEIVDLLVDKTVPGLARPDYRIYAWYIRVADLPAFMRCIASVLERRLVGSGANRYTGDLNIALFDQNGLRLSFEDGRLVEAVYEAMEAEEADAAMPRDQFIEVVFGRRTAVEIAHAFPEAYTTRKGAVLLDALFPRRRSWVVGIA
ncbi:MAG: GNAT family N-acetyltransferase [bacterium]|nr:GNAT family N-acetyltransferase [bacterium]